MNSYKDACARLRSQPCAWLVTGAAGFIGSHLVETLLGLDQRIVALDDLTTGSLRNIEEVFERITPAQRGRFEFHNGSVADLDLCRKVCTRVDFVLHHAGFTSVPLSNEDPIRCHHVNVTGTLNLLVAAREMSARRFIYASSSAVYGDDLAQSKSELNIGSPLSPYGASKLMAEMYARLFFQHYGLQTIGLRYFNIFGPRQSATGGHAPVIPHWIGKCLRGEECVINGDGGIRRDFCHVADAVQANILAATTGNPSAFGMIFNVGLGDSITLSELHTLISERSATLTGKSAIPARFGESHAGDIFHSCANIDRSRKILGFEPGVSLESGLDETVRSYFRV